METTLQLPVQYNIKAWSQGCSTVEFAWCTWGPGLKPMTLQIQHEVHAE